MEPQDEEDAPKQTLPEDLRKLLKQMDPTWSGKKPTVPHPIPLDDAGQITLRQTLGPTLRLPLDLARDARQLLAEIANETGREEFAHVAEALGQLIAQQFPETRPLGRVAQVGRDLKVLAFGGGWDPGQRTLYAGTRIYLISQRGEEVTFGAANGPRSIPVGRFPASEMDALQILEE